MEDALLSYRSRITELEQENSQLSHKNQELQGICCLLEDDRHATRRLATEWQEFGKYTALLYKSEIESFAVKLKTLEDKFSALLAENKDLRELCLYLDQLQATTNGNSVEIAPSLASLPASKRLPLHVLCALELNEQLGDSFPRYGGTTNTVTLNEQRPPWQGRLQQLRSSDPEQCIEQLEQRVERLESEKLELIKSLSVAHLLGTMSPLQEDQEEAKRALSLPMLAQEARPHNAPSRAAMHPTNPLQEGKMVGSTRAPEVVMSAVALLDLCSRLDVTEVEAPADVQEMAEMAMLRLLIDIAWNKLMEQN